MPALSVTSTKIVRSIRAFMAGQILFVNWLLLNILLADCQTIAGYDKLMQRPIGPFEMLEVRDHFLIIEEKGIVDTISVDRVTLVYSPHRHRLLKRKIKDAPRQTRTKTNEMNSSSITL